MKLKEVSTKYLSGWVKPILIGNIYKRLIFRNPKYVLEKKY